MGRDLETQFECTKYFNFNVVGDQAFKEDVKMPCGSNLMSTLRETLKFPGQAVVGKLAPWAYRLNFDL